MLAEFHFLRPWWFIALLPWLLLIWQLRRGVGSTAWQQLVDQPLLAWLSGTTVGGNSWRSKLLILLAIAGLLAVTALAGPVWERQPQPVVRATQAKVIVLDLSRSMLSTDQRPSRLEQARFKLADILNRSREGQTGLVAYAGEAFVISPLTEDSRTILALLPALAPDIMPVQGGRADLALQQAADLLRQAGENGGDILLLTDGINAERTIPVAENLAASGIRLSVLGIGTEQGAPIPLPEGGFVQDRQGNIVIPRMDPQALRSLAAAGGGRYSRLTVDAQDLDYLFPELDPDAVEQAQSQRESDDQLNHELWHEQGPWLVLLLLPLAALAFRRGWLFCWCLLPMLTAYPDPVQAAWKDWWKNPAQQTRDALDQGEHEQAAMLAEQLQNQPLLAGESHYRNGDYEAAIEAFEQAFASNRSADSAYNLGNALAQLGSIDEAIGAYEQALELAPDMQDAKDNLELLKQLREQQEQQPQGQGEQDQQQGDQQQQGQNQEQQDQNQEGQQEQQQSGDQQQEGQQQQSEEQSGEQQQEQQQAGQQQSTDEQQQEQETEESGAENDQNEQQEGEQSAAQEQQGELSEEQAEQQRAVEQWLRKIPDDPGGLLRNKFRYQYQQRQRTADSDEEDW